VAGAPLPLRGGLGPDRVRMPAGSAATTVLEFLRAEFPGEDWAGRIAVGELVDEHGRAVGELSRCQPTRFVYFYREPPPEPAVPFEVEVLYRGDGLVVVDKPHFLATIPRGAHIRETVTVRLRRDLGLPDLVPVHRLDRMTAGVLLCTADRALRRPYQQMFERQQVRKVYEAVAGFREDVAFPRVVRSRIVKEHGQPTAREVVGEPNAETTVEVIERRGDRARYRLRPVTGRTHQLRLHMASLGVPIVGDDFYPRVRRRAPGEFADPLRLVARSLAFTDPVSGVERCFVSGRSLSW